jgi:hypothetical protein
MLNNDRREASDTAPDERVVLLLEAAAAPTEPGPLPGEAEALAAFRASQPTPRRSPMLSSLTSVKTGIAAVLGTGVLLTGGVGMAAAGALPEGAQDTASAMLAKVGVTVPGAAEVAVADAGKGESTADEASADREMPDASKKGQDVSDLARNTELEGADKGAAVSDLASEGKSRAGEENDGSQARVDGGAVAGEKQAQAAEGDERAEGSRERAATEAPNDGGTDTADGATTKSADGSSTAGTGTAGETSDGRSGAGSANRP